MDDDLRREREDLAQLGTAHVIREACGSAAAGTTDTDGQEGAPAVEAPDAMKSVVFALTWQTRTANLTGELRGEVVNDRHVQILLKDLSARGFLATLKTPVPPPATTDAPEQHDNRK